MNLTPFCRQCGCTYEMPCCYEENGVMRTCGWADEVFTLCTNPACVQWARQFVKPALQAAVSNHCICGAWKRSPRAFCRRCWNAVPWEIGGSLFANVRHGFELYYFDSVRWLHANTDRLEHVTNAELLRLADEAVGRAAKERVA